MKTLYAILFVIYISYCNSIICGDENDENYKTYSFNSVNDCKQLELDTGDYICCFFEVTVSLDGRKESGKTCDSLTKAQYDELDEYIDYVEETYEKGYGLDDVDIDVDCTSKYIIIPLLSLIMLFF